MKKNDLKSVPIKKLASLFRHPFSFIIALVRFVAGFSILIDPFWGVLFSLFLDHLDAYVMRDYAGFSYREYQAWDKMVDFLIYPFLVIASFGSGIFYIILGLFVFRLAGLFLFFLTSRERYLYYFPNFVGGVFFVFISLRSIGIMADINSLSIWILVFGLVLIQETIMHLWYPKHLIKKWQIKRIN